MRLFHRLWSYKCNNTSYEMSENGVAQLLEEAIEEKDLRGLLGNVSTSDLKPSSLPFSMLVLSV